MHTELNLQKLDERRDQHLSELCHKNVYIDKVASLGQFFQVTPARNQRGTRQRNKMHMVVPRTRTMCGRNAISIRGPMHGMVSRMN